MRNLIEHGLEQTASLWPDIEPAYTWIHQAAHILNNHEDEDAATVQRRFNAMVGAMACHRDRAGSLSEAIDHFGKLTRSDRPGLFHCYGVPDLPRTDNDLEHDPTWTVRALSLFIRILILSLFNALIIPV